MSINKIDFLRRIKFQYIILILMIYFTSWSWELLNLKFTNNENIISIITISKFNPLNNDIRFFFFVSINLLSYYFSINYLSNFKYSILYILKFDSYQKKEIKKNNKQIYILFFIILFILFVEFFLQKFPIHKLDFFHEGEWLTPAFHYLKTGNLLPGLYYTHGFFYDLLKPILAWNIFGNISIGAVRYFDIILIFLTKILLLILSFRIAIYLNISNQKKFLFIIFLNLIFIEILTYNTLEYQYFTYRDIPLIIFLIFSLEIFNNNKLAYFFIFLSGFFTFFTYLLTIDRGIYYSFIIFFFFIIFLIQKKYKNIIFLLSGILCSYIILRFIFSLDELINYFYNFSTILKNKSFLDNYIYPTPFFSGETTSTKALLSLIIGGVLVINLFFKDNKKLNLNKNIVFFVLALCLISFIIFKNALGRSDAAHIKYSLGFNYLLIGLLLINNILIKVKKNSIINNKSLVICVIFLCIFLYFKNYNLFNYNHLINYPGNLKKYLSLKDTFFLDEKKILMLEDYLMLTKNQDCEINITNEPAWAYLLKKKSCTKFYVSWFSASDFLQKAYVEDIKVKKIKYILYSSNFQFFPDGLDNKVRIGEIMNYIEDNYMIESSKTFFKIAHLK